ELVSKLVTQAVIVGKDIIIEDLVSLDSNKKQEKTTSKEYNRMINSLKFGLFKRCLLSKAAKEGVSVHSVTPYNTSKIARKSYTNRMKLNVHDAASYVIARRFYQYELVSKLVTQAVIVGKDIIIEDLVSLDSNKKQEK
ncbi:IS200/IS605 family element transposase accessory protein TnpB, partial [Mycobacterium tuberculosis]|nr:IS200/IS605 family element transposase accessory protein TnpB [Mycobacterium tuberculosis]